MGRIALGIATVIAMAAAPAPAASRSSCDRECLIGMTDQFLKALVAHDPTRVPLAPGYKSTVNGTREALGGDIWRAVDAITFHQYVPDPVSGQIAFYGVAEEQFRRGTFYLRLKVQDRKLAEIEIVAGSRVADGVPGLISPNPLFDYVLPRNQRRNRKELVAIADSYFEGLQRHDGSSVPVSADCRRFEDGVQTSLNPIFMPRACNDFAPFTYMDRTSSRTYPVVDETRGLVVGQMVIEVSTPRGPPATSSQRVVNPISGMVMPPNPMRSKPRHTIIRELFKVIDGKITEIQTVRLDLPYGSGDGWGQ